MVLAQLKNEIVGLGPLHLVQRRDYGLSIVDIFLVLRHEIGARVFKAVHGVGAGAVEHTDGGRAGLSGGA